MTSLKDRLRTSRPHRLVDVPESDDKVGVRSMSVGQRRRFVELSKAAQGNGKGEVDPTKGVRLTEIVFAWCAYDPETNEPLLENEEDPAIEEYDAQLIDVAATACLEASGMDVKAHIAAKNASAASVDSPSSSPSD